MKRWKIELFSREIDPTTRCKSDFSRKKSRNIGCNMKFKEKNHGIFEKQAGFKAKQAKKRRNQLIFGYFRANQAIFWTFQPVQREFRLVQRELAAISAAKVMSQGQIRQPDGPHSVAHGPLLVWDLKGSSRANTRKSQINGPLARAFHARSR